MAQTFHATFPRVDIKPLTDGLASIFNAEESDARRVFEVTRIAVRPPSAYGAANGSSIRAAVVGLYRITAMSGGAPVSAAQRDTGAAALPGQVSCATYPDSVTVSGAAIRKLADAPSLTFAGSNQWTCGRVFGGSLFPYMRGNHADVMRFGGDATIERIVLREGEGVAFVLDAFGFPRAGQINVVLAVQGTNATHQFRSRDIGHPYRVGDALLALFNGAGSGVVLEVNAIEYPNDGESNFPTFRLAKIDRATGGDAVSPVAADTDNAIPAALVCMGGDFDSALFGSGQGVQYDWATKHGATLSVLQQQNIGTLRRITGTNHFGGIGVSSGLRPGPEEVELFSAPAGSGIILRPQEGLALLAGRAGALESSTFAYLNVEATVLHYPPAAGSGTFPAVGDVEAGVVYGPTDNLTGTLALPAAGDVDLGVGYGASGTEFSGTLKQPAEADVRSGTQYGAGGTEFTGSLVAGGGGAGTVYLRRGR